MAAFHYLKSCGGRKKMEPDLSQRCTVIKQKQGIFSSAAARGILIGNKEKRLHEE